MKKLLIAALLGVAAMAARADYSAADALISAPLQVRGALGASKLADLVEYARAGMFTHTEKNAAGDEARIWTLDSMRCEVQTSPGRMLTLQLLPAKNDTVIAVIETLTSQHPDSRLTVYSREWKPQPKLWSEPKPEEWGKVDSLPILLVEYTYAPEEGILTLNNHSEDKEHMLDAIRFEWTPKGFKRLKK